MWIQLQRYHDILTCSFSRKSSCHEGTSCWFISPFSILSFQGKAACHHTMPCSCIETIYCIILQCFSEIPLIIVLPFMEFTIAYFIAGMHGPGQWILSFFILVVSCFAAQVSECTHNSLCSLASQLQHLR